MLAIAVLRILPGEFLENSWQCKNMQENNSNLKIGELSFYRQAVVVADPQEAKLASGPPPELAHSSSVGKLKRLKLKLVSDGWSLTIPRNSITVCCFLKYHLLKNRCGLIFLKKWRM